MTTVEEVDMRMIQIGERNEKFVKHIGRTKACNVGNVLVFDAKCLVVTYSRVRNP